jgi:hypothetical protein
VKEAKRNNKKILLRTVPTSNFDEKRDARQILKMVYIETLSATSFSTIPLTSEVDSIFQMEL